MILLNLWILICFWASGEVKDLASIIGAGIAVLLMNAVAWRSGKDFPEWK